MMPSGDTQEPSGGSRAAAFTSSMTRDETDEEKGHVLHNKAYMYGKKEAKASSPNSSSNADNIPSETNPTGPEAASSAYSASSNLMNAIEATNSGTTGKRKRKEDEEDKPTDDAAAAAAAAKTKNRRSSAKESRDRRKQLFEDLQMSVARLAQENRELKRNNEAVTAENSFLKSQLLGLLKGGFGGSAALSPSPAAPAPPSTTSVASAAVTTLFQNQEQQQLQSLLQQLSKPSPILAGSSAAATTAATASATNPSLLGLQSTLQQRLTHLQAAQSGPPQPSPLLSAQQIQLGRQLLGLQPTPSVAASSPAIVSQEGLSRLDQNSKSQLLVQLISSLSSNSNNQQQDLNNARFGGI